MSPDEQGKSLRQNDEGVDPQERVPAEAFVLAGTSGGTALLSVVEVRVLTHQ